MALKYPESTQYQGELNSPCHPTSTMRPVAWYGDFTQFRCNVCENMWTIKEKEIPDFIKNDVSKQEGVTDEA